MVKLEIHLPDYADIMKYFVIPFVSIMSYFLLSREKTVDIFLRETTFAKLGPNSSQRLRHVLLLYHCHHQYHVTVDVPCDENIAATLQICNNIITRKNMCQQHSFCSGLKLLMNEIHSYNQ